MVDFQFDRPTVGSGQAYISYCPNSQFSLHFLSLKNWLPVDGPSLGQAGGVRLIGSIHRSWHPVEGKGQVRIIGLSQSINVSYPPNSEIWSTLLSVSWFVIHLRQPDPGRVSWTTLLNHQLDFEDRRKRSYFSKRKAKFQSSIKDTWVDSGQDNKCLLTLLKYLHSKLDQLHEFSQLRDLIHFPAPFLHVEPALPHI